mgnify:CR=1 FL=1
MKAATLRRLIVMALIILWEVLPRSGLIPELFLPSLSSTPSSFSRSTLPARLLGS